MPMINLNVGRELSTGETDEIRNEVKKLIGVLGKPVNFLMTSINSNCDLALGDESAKDGAFIEVKLLGSPSKSACNEFSTELFKILEDKFNINPKHTYITYMGYDKWGWNGGNF